MPPPTALNVVSSLCQGPRLPNAAVRCFSATGLPQASTSREKRRQRDPYALAQARARKQANLSRQAVLKEERKSTFTDPVRGSTTAFVRSFDTGELESGTSSSTVDASSDSKNSASSQSGAPLNFFVSRAELDDALQRSRRLTSPSSLRTSFEKLDSGATEDVDQTQGEGEALSGEQQSTAFSGLSYEQLFAVKKPSTPFQQAKQIRVEQNNAEEAVRRIASLSIGSSKDRLRVNTQRIIESFGRHKTDSVLEPKPQAIAISAITEKTPRVGPDTGSSEVQIGILTAKIRALADYLDSRGKPDKANKRNLRLLVHRRAKLLKYLRRKERGGPRWQNLIETLGLTESTWKGEISL